MGKFVICDVKFGLSETQYVVLRRMQKKERASPRRYKKITVLIMLHQKYNISDIESVLGLDDNTIHRYQEGYEQQGLEGYLSDGYLVYRGKMSEEQEAELVVHLDKNLYLDAHCISVYVQSRFGVRYSVSGITALLHRLGFVYKRTRAVPSRADDEAQVEFLDRTLPSLLEETRKGKAVVYYADGCHPTHNTKTGCGWIRKGQDFEIDCNSGRKRVNINAAINALKPEHLVYETTHSINAQSTQRLCRKLLKKHRDKTIYLICDNAGYNKNKMLQDWALNQRVEFIFLPPYSPNLNLIERLWRLLRKQTIHSMYYDTYSKFKEGIEAFLDNIKSYKIEVRNLLTLNFQTVGGTSFYAQTTL